MRSEERMVDLEGQVYQHPWPLPHDNVVAMLVYAMVQEWATALNYRNLRRRAPEQGGDPALERLLTLLTVDEQTHHSFFLGGVRLYLAHDRDATLEQLRRVMHGFAMPAIYGLADGRQRAARIKELDIFNNEIYVREVYFPILQELEVTRPEMRSHYSTRKSVPTNGAF